MMLLDPLRFHWVKVPARRGMVRSRGHRIRVGLL